LAIVKYSNELPILNCENSLQKSRFLQMIMKWEMMQCNARYEIIGHDKNLAKRATWFGAMVWKLCTFEVQSTLGHVLIISLQPQMRNWCSWTFWKWERKIYNFHVQQNFIWSIFGHVILRRKPFHFWQFQITGHFLFFGKFLSDLKFSIVDVWNVKW